MSARSHTRSRNRAVKRQRRRFLIHLAAKPKAKRTSERRRTATARNKREVERTVEVLTEKGDTR